jgi:hypothetical protein
VSKFREKVRPFREIRGCDDATQAVDTSNGLDSALWYRGTRTKRTAQAGYVAGAVCPVMMRELQEQPNGSKERAVDRRH